MKYVLDGMVELMEGGGSFDDDLYESFVQCFEQTDPQLMASQVQNSFTNEISVKKCKAGFHTTGCRMGWHDSVGRFWGVRR